MNQVWKRQRLAFTIKFESEIIHFSRFKTYLKHERVRRMDEIRNVSFGT